MGPFPVFSSTVRCPRPTRQRLLSRPNHNKARIKLSTLRRAKQADDHSSMLTIVARSRCKTKVAQVASTPRASIIRAVLRSRQPPKMPGISCTCNERRSRKRRAKRRVPLVRRLVAKRGSRSISRRLTRKRQPSRKIMLHKCPCSRKDVRQIHNRTMPVRIAREVAAIQISCRR